MRKPRSRRGPHEADSYRFFTSGFLLTVCCGTAVTQTGAPGTSSSTDGKPLLTLQMPALPDPVRVVLKPATTPDGGGEGSGCFAREWASLDGRSPKQRCEARPQESQNEREAALSLVRLDLRPDDPLRERLSPQGL